MDTLQHQSKDFAGRIALLQYRTVEYLQQSNHRKKVTQRTDLLPEHRHFFDSEGNDFGFFGDDNVRPDRKRNLPLYTYGDVKYDADIIDRAVRKYETYINQVQEKISTFTKSTKDIITNQVHGHVNVGNYGLILNNCQDYVSNILYIARRISEKERIPLILP